MKINIITHWFTTFKLIIITFEEAKKIAREGIKVTHRYFSPDEYLTMQGNLIIFEDGCRIFVDEWTKGKDYLNDGWRLYV